MNNIRQQLRQFLAQPATEWSLETVQRAHGVVLPPGASNLQVLEAIFGPTREIDGDE